MDTRTKIIAPEDVRERLRDKPACWVAGHFDPLLASHARLLRERAKPGHYLVVEVTNPAHPLLPQRARAELVAALRMVDYVVLGDGAQAADEGLTEKFVRHVLQRHRGESAG